MKTSFISSLSMQTTMRYAVARAQQDMVAAQQEVTTGRHSDVGVALGATTARSLDLTRDILRIKSTLSTNSLATQRLEASEEALAEMASIADKITQGLITLGGSEDSKGIETYQATIRGSLNAFASLANTSVAGEYLFAGINSDVMPFEDIADPASGARAAIERELNLFLAAQVPPATKATLTDAQMGAFMTQLEGIFDGTQALTPVPPAIAGEDFWTTFVSNASDTNMKSRISQSEIVETSTNANANPMRDFVLASFASEMFINSETSTAGRDLAQGKIMNFVSTAKGGLDAERARLGLSSERVKKADVSLQDQNKIIETHLNDLQSVDAYEASTRVKGLEALIEASYTLTARLQQLSLVNFLK